jgi:hypothetical protein
VTNVNGTITWSIGNLAFSVTGTGPTMTVATRTTLAGIGLCSASVTSSVYDPLKGNNFAEIKIEVDQPMLSISGVSPSFELTWSALATNYVLQGATNLPPQGIWVTIPTPPVVNGEYIFSLPGTGGYQFFRLSTQMP